jgi:thymidylate synthase (FAD)
MITDRFPAMHVETFRTAQMTPYLKGPGVATLAIPETSLDGMLGFLRGFDDDLGFQEYLADPTVIPPAEQLCKAAGQICYMSLGPKRTQNEAAAKYLDHIKSSGHGSVLEHANVSFLFYGISRSITHELVRHRSGCAYSQVSQRYCSGSIVRFIERPEYQADSELHAQFEARIDKIAAEYETTAERLLALQKSGSEILSGEARTELRKKVQQCARSVLPNETEAPIVMTANLRAWRHIVEMRANPAAEVEIRALAFKAYQCLTKIAPLIFNDYEVVDLPDGTKGVSTKYRKV